jgi:hypothetical protein
MFDKLIVQNTREYVDGDIEINVHNAPTDESVKLLKEYQEKAYAWVREAASTRLDNLNINVLSLVRDDWSFESKAAVKINDKVYIFSVPEHYIERDKENLVKNVINFIAAQIAIQIFDLDIKENSKCFVR